MANRRREDEAAPRQAPEVAETLDEARDQADAWLLANGARRESPPPLTSEACANLLRAAHDRWPLTALRTRLDDGDRGEWMERFAARAMTLIPHWRRLGL